MARPATVASRRPGELGQRPAADERGEPQDREDARQVGVAAVQRGTVEQLRSDERQQRVHEDDRAEAGDGAARDRSTADELHDDAGAQRQRDEHPDLRPDAESRTRTPSRRPSSRNRGIPRTASRVNGSRAVATPDRPNARYHATYTRPGTNIAGTTRQRDRSSSRSSPTSTSMKIPKPEVIMPTRQQAGRERDPGPRRVVVQQEQRGQAERDRDQEPDLHRPVQVLEAAAEEGDDDRGRRRRATGWSTGGRRRTPPPRRRRGGPPAAPDTACRCRARTSRASAGRRRS